MPWIKAHLTVVVVAAICLLSLTALVLGVVLSDVGEELNKDVQLFNGLGSLKPVNEQVINQARAEARRVSEQLDAFLRPYRAASEFKPLIEEVFAADKPLDVNPAWQFHKLYARAQLDLLKLLQAGSPPTSSDIQAHAQRRKREQEKLEREKGIGLGAGSPPGRPSGPYSPAPRPTGGPGPTGQPSRTAGQESDYQIALEYSVMHARGIRCYASLENLDLRPEVSDPRKIPAIEDMWYAQVSLWLQQAVLKSLADLNDRVAKQLEQKGEKPWVANLPVKRLVDIRMGNYVPPATGAMDTDSSARSSGSTGETSLLPGRASAVFTQRGSKSNVDVLHFYVILIIDAGSLQEVVSAISASECGFCTPLNVSYEVEPADLALKEGHLVYGTAPTIKVALVYETCMLRANYQKWIPKTVADAITAGTAGGAAGGRAPAQSGGSSTGRGQSPSSGARGGEGSPGPSPGGTGRRRSAADIGS